MGNWTGREKRAEKAKAHHSLMLQTKKQEITNSALMTREYGGNVPMDALMAINTNRHTTGRPNIVVEKSDSVASAFKHAEGLTAILNFADFKKAGGMYLEGSGAQEEDLCHKSILYEVLLEQSYYYEQNKTKLNKGLYDNHGIYSPRVWFQWKEEEKLIDVITMAAPNWHAAQMSGVLPKDNTMALDARIRFVLDIAELNKVDTLIFGAYGCGVFGQDPYEVADLCFNAIYHRNHPHATYGFKTVYFPIPDERNLLPFETTLLSYSIGG